MKFKSRDLVRVEWVDSVVPHNSWIIETDDIGGIATDCVSVGWIKKIDKIEIQLAQSISNQDAEAWHELGVVSIPRLAISSIKKLK